MGKSAEELADFIYLTSDNSRGEDPKAIIRDILHGMSAKQKRKIILDRKKAIQTAIREARKGDLLLLVGKGHEGYEIKDGHILPFDERKIAHEALEKRRAAYTNKDGGGTT